MFGKPPIDRVLNQFVGFFENGKFFAQPVILIDRGSIRSAHTGWCKKEIIGGTIFFLYI